MSNLMELARSVAARLPVAGVVPTPAGRKGDKGENPVHPDTFSPLSPFSPAAVPVESVPLRGNELWDRRVAVKLMYDADTLVEQLGVDGRHPAIANAAARAVSAADTRDMETFRFAVSEFAVIVRRVARERLSAGGTGRNAADTGENTPVAARGLTTRKSMEPDGIAGVSGGTELRA